MTDRQTGRQRDTPTQREREKDKYIQAKAVREGERKAECMREI